MAVRREVDIEASPEEVWQALVTEQGRERWLDEPAREVVVTESQPAFPLAALAMSFAAVAA
jgi:uncharacterized protein YndB with AHSA1/START domain